MVDGKVERKRLESIKETDMVFAMEKLSVIIPAYNAEKYLAEAVSSVREQNWPGGMEVILVDDGSLDRTLEIARNLGDIVLTQTRGGAARARNAGIRASTGEWIFFLDADDVLAPDALARLYAPFSEKKELAASFGRAMDFLSPELTEEQLKTLPGERQDYGGILPGCALLRRKAFERVGFFDEELRSAETVAWQIRLRESGLQVAFIEAVTLRRRIHLNNTGRVNRQQEMQNYAEILRKKMRSANKSGNGQ